MLLLGLLAGCTSVLGLDEFEEDSTADAGASDASKPDVVRPDVTLLDASVSDGAEVGPPPDGSSDAAQDVVTTYAWKTGGWSACSAPCGGGARTRPVWCEADDGTKVDDSMCSGAKPATSEACNTQPCCTPTCAPRDACGSDGCGGSCGTCDYDPDRFCHNGYCVWDHGNDGSVTCNTLCSWGSSQCVDTSTGSCGEKINGECFCW